MCLFLLRIVCEASAMVISASRVDDKNGRVPEGTRELTYSFADASLREFPLLPRSLIPSPEIELRPLSFRPL
jgi:hypothetical protein